MSSVTKNAYKPSFALKPRRWLTVLIVCLYLAESSLQVVYAAGGAGGTITADPNAGSNRPTVDRSANDVPVVNIARPNSAGLSHNKYRDFNVPEQGTILNNSGKETQTQLAGWIAKNDNLAPGESARLILNEVTGPDISRLAGYLEVAGAPADIIIANPNGIVGTGFGFINTSRVTLTTGAPEIDAAGNLRSFAVRGGKITINGDGPAGAAGGGQIGVNASNLEQFDLLARAIEINAQVHARQLNLVTGANRVAYADLGTEKIAPNSGEPAPLVALDIAALGGMYANRIRLVGTEAGLGVNSRGDIAAGAGGFTLTSEGKVVLNGQATSESEIVIRARDGIANAGVVHAAAVTLTADGAAAAHIENTGHISSTSDLTLAATGSVNSGGLLAAGLAAGGKLAPDTGALTATAGLDLAATGENYAGREIRFAAQNINLDGAFTQAPAVTLAGIDSGAITHRAAAFFASTLTVNAGSFDNTDSAIHAARDIAFVLGNDALATAAPPGLDNTRGEIVASGFLSISNRNSKIKNLSGALVSGGDFSVSAGALDNTSGGISAGGLATLAIDDGVDNTGGRIVSTGDLRITNQASDLINTGGLIQTAGALSILVRDSALRGAAGSILAGGALDIQALSLDTTAGLVGANSDVTINVAGALVTANAAMIAGRDISLSAASLDNSGGGIDAARALAIFLQSPEPGAPAFLNNTGGQLIARGATLTITAHSIDNARGYMATGTNLELVLRDAFSNNEGTVTASGAFLLRAAGISNLGGLLSAGGAMTLDALSGGIANTGEILSSGPLSMTARSAIENTGAGALIGSNASLGLTADSFSNSGKISSGGNLALDGSSLENNGGAITAAGNALVTLRDFLINNGGLITSGSVLAITAGGAVSSSGSTALVASRVMLALDAAALENSGLISSGSAMRLTLADALSNRDGSIEADSTLAVSAARLDNTRGRIVSAGGAAITVRETSLLNNGGLLAAADALELSVAGALANGAGGEISARMLGIAAASIDNSAGFVSGGDSLDIVSAADLLNANGAISSGGALDIDAGGAITNSGSGAFIGANSTLTLSAASLANTGVISAARELSLSVAGEIANAGGGYIATNSTFTLRAASLDNSGGGIFAGDRASLDLTGAFANRAGILAAGGDLHLGLHGAIDNSGAGEISASGNLTLGAASLDNTTGAVSAGGSAQITLASALLNHNGVLTSAGALAIDAGGAVTSTGGDAVIATNATLSVRADSFANAGLVSAGGLVTLSLRNALANRGGIESGGAFLLDADNLDNAGGSIIATGSARLALAGAFANAGGLLASDGDLHLRAGDTVDNGSAGEISTAGSLALFAASLDNSTGLITSGSSAAIVLASGDLLNAAGALTSGGALALDVAGTVFNTGSNALIGTNATLTINAAALANSGLISSKNAADIALADALDNSGGALASGASLRIAGKSLANVSGEISSAGALSLALSGTGVLDNTQGIINAAGNSTLSLAQSELRNTGGLLTAAGELVITAASLDNSGTGILYSGSDARFTLSGVFDNRQGSLQTGGALDITLHGLLDNTLGEILSAGGLEIENRDFKIQNSAGFIGGNSTLALTAASLDNTAGTITFNGDTALTLAGAFTNTADACLVTGGKLTLAAASMDNRLGIIKAVRAIDARITGAWDNSAQGIVVAGTGGLSMTLGGVLDNTTGAIISAGDLEIETPESKIENSLGEITADSDALITAAAITSSAGVISANGALSLATTAGDLDNNGGLISAGGTTRLDLARSLLNASGQIVAGGISATAQNLDNRAGYIGSADALGLALGGSLDNSASGAILAGGVITIDAGAINNAHSGSAGGIFGNDALGITARAGGIDNTGGSITALGALALATLGGLANTDGSIQSAAGLSLTNTGTAALDNTRGFVSAHGFLTIENQDSKIENSSGSILASDGAALSAAQITNNAGLIQTGGDLGIAVQGDLDNARGAILSAKNLRIAAGAGPAAFRDPDFAIINTDGFIQSAADLTITNPSAAALDNTRGVITASGNLTIENRESKIENSSGFIATGGTGNASIVTGTLASGGGGALVSGGDLALTLGTGDLILDGTQEFWANGDISVTLKDGAFVNTGTNLAAYGLFTIDASKGITNRAGALLHAGSLDLRTAGTLLNLGRIDADYINANAGVIQNRSVIIGQIVSLDARELYNTGAAAIIASTQFLGLYTSDLLSNTRDIGVTGTNVTGATIFTLGDLVIAGRGGLDAGGNPVSHAGRVENSSSTIEASGNGMIFAANFENKKDAFATETYLYETRDFNDSNLDGTHVFKANKQSQGGRLYEGLSYYWNRDENSTWLEYTRRTYRTRIIQDSPEARLLVSNNLTISAGVATNYISTVAAGGSLIYYNSGLIENINVSNVSRAVHGNNGVVDVWELDKKPQTIGSDKYERKKTGSWTILDEIIDLQKTSGADPRYDARIIAGQSIIGSAAGLYNGEAANRPDRSAHTATDTSVSGPSLPGITGGDPIAGHAGTDNSSATAGAGNTAAITDPASGHDTTVGDINAGSTHNTSGNTVTTGTHSGGVATIDNPGAPATTNPGIAPVAPPAGEGSGGVIPGGKTLPGFTITAPGDVVFTVPQNPLYTVSTDPGHPYLIVTDPRFTNWDNFISSDYFFQKLGSDPQAMHKRLGDGFYENRLILDQITALTGRRFIGDYRAEDEQFKALMDNALALADSFNLRPGIALTPDQLARLDLDIVWLVETTVNGQTVLAPVVYLSNATRATIESGAVIAATDIDLNITGDAINRGTIRADRDMRLQAANILNDGGALKSGGDMTLVAKTDITSYAGRISAGGNATLVAGRDIRLASVADVTDFGIDNARGGSPLGTRTTVRNQTLSAGGDLLIQAGRDLTLTGVGIAVGGNAALVATRDLTLDVIKNVSRFDAGDSRNFIHLERIDHTLTTIDVAGSLALRAGNFALGDTAAPPVDLGNINIISARLRSGGDLTLAATGNIDLTAVKDRDFSDIQSTSKKRMDHNMRDDETVLGAALQSGGNITLSAGSAEFPLGTSSPSATGNITLASAYLNASGAVSLAATNDITLATTNEHHEQLTETMRKKSGVLSSKTKTTRDEYQADYAVGSVVSADTVTMQSGRDLAIIGSSVAADGDIALRAGRDLTIASAQNTIREDHFSETKRSGMMGSGGVGVTFGKQKDSREQEDIITESLGSLVGSIGGRVDLYAGRDAAIIGSELFSHTGLTLDAQNILIGAAQNTVQSTYTEKHAKSGVTIALKGGIVDMALAVYNTIERGTGVKDDRLQGLYAAKTAYAAMDMYQGISGGGALQAMDNGKNGEQGIKIAVSYGNSKSEYISKTTMIDFVGSSLTTAGDLTLVARSPASGGSFQLPVSPSGDIAIIGSELSGANITLSAANDITIESALNEHSLRSDNKNFGFNVGVSLGVGQGGGGLQIFADVTLGKGHENGDGLTNTNSHITAADTLSIISGRDTTIAGAQLRGEALFADIGRDLTILSRQDTDTYDARQQQISAQGSGGMGGGGGGVSFSYSKTESDYASVVEQTGLFAGKGGFDINVGNHTSLTGAVIASEAAPAHNRLSTQTISHGDIQNHSEFDAKSISISVSSYGPPQRRHESPIRQPKRRDAQRHRRWRHHRAGRLRRQRQQNLGQPRQSLPRHRQRQRQRAKPLQPRGNPPATGSSTNHR